MALHSVQHGANLHQPVGAYDTTDGNAYPLDLTASQAQAYLINMATGNAAVQIDTTNDRIDLGNATDDTAVRILGTGGLTLVTSGADITWTAGGSIIFPDATNNSLIMEDASGDNYLAITTLASFEDMSFGNATTNPDYQFLGTGSTTLGGDLVFDGAASITSTAGAIDWDINTGSTSALRVMDGTDVMLEFDSTSNHINVGDFSGYTTAEVAITSDLAFLQAPSGATGQFFIVRTAASNDLFITANATSGGTITFGNATAARAMDFLFTGSGAGTTTFNTTVDFQQPIHLNASAGTSGQVLTSQGAGVDPIWSTAGSGGLPLSTPDNAVSTSVLEDDAGVPIEYIAITTTNGSEVLDFGNTGNNPAFNFLGTGTATFGGDITISAGNINASAAIDINVQDNTASALTIDDGTDNYLNITTTTGSETVDIGNASNNPAYSFLGSGSITVGGSVIGVNSGGGFVIGNSGAAIGTNSIVIGGGSSTATSGVESVSLGDDAVTSGGYAVSVGANTNNAGSCTGVGYFATGTSFSTALGWVATAKLSGIAIGQDATNGSYSGSVAIGSDVDNTAAKQVVIGGGSGWELTEFIMGGEGDLSATPFDTTWRINDGTGTNIAGADLTIAAGAGTGTGVAGTLKLQTSPSGTTGTTLHTQRDRITVQPDGAMFFNSASDGTSYAAMRFQSGYVDTTDGTATAMITIPLANSTNHNTMYFTAHVTGSAASGTDIGDHFSSSRAVHLLYDSSWAISVQRSIFHDDGDGTAPIGSEDLGNNGSIAWAINGSNLELQVTGTASTTWHWSGWAQGVIQEGAG